MKQNITLSLEKELITKAKIIAAQKSSSVSKMLAEELRKVGMQLTQPTPICCEKDVRCPFGRLSISFGACS